VQLSLPRGGVIRGARRRHPSALSLRPTTPTSQGEGPRATSTSAAAAAATSDDALARTQRELDAHAAKVAKAAEQAAKAAEQARLDAARAQAEYDALHPKPLPPKPFKLDEACLKSSLCLEDARKDK